MKHLSAIRAQFPLLQRKMRGAPLAYLDSAATALTPQAVIEAVGNYYAHYGVSVHRGTYQLSEEATAAYEETRQHCIRFLGCNDDYVIIFTRGATESINLIAHSFVEHYLQAGDEILLTECEHHANIVPWQQAAARQRLKLRALKVDAQSGALLEEELSNWQHPPTRLLTLTAMSNVTGYRPPVRRLISEAQQAGIYTVIDAAQEAPHSWAPMTNLNCDFYLFSAHKLFGPTGVGILCARRSLLEQCPPFLGGGNIILRVEIEQSSYRNLPARFEAGTPNIAGVVGLRAALEWYTALDHSAALAHEQEIASYALKELQKLPQLRIYGDPAAFKSPIISFNLANIHPHDVAAIVDQHGVAIRVGHHCAQPYLRALGSESVARASFSIYNQKSDVDQLQEGLAHACELFN